jgi:Mrp family chromosome partitioning ATPase
MSTIYQALERSETTRRAVTTATTTVAPPPHAERPGDEYERLKVMLSLESGARLRRVLLVSATGGEGVSSVSLGLAAAAAESAPQGVLLVESHPGRATLAGRLGISAPIGIGELLAKEAPREQAILPTNVPRLALLTRGRRPVDLSQPRWAGLFDELMSDVQSGFDLCVLDGGALDTSPESLAVAARVDGVLLVVEAERTSMSRVEAAAEMLAHAGAHVVGVVLNRHRQYVPNFIERRLA